MNKGFACARHRDGANAGPSMLQAVGDFEGGNLLVWPDDNGSGSVDSLSVRDAVELDTRSWQWIDGRQAHETQPFTGERISAVFYVVSDWEQATEETVQVLGQLGVVLPQKH